MAKIKVDKELIRELAALLDETGLSEIEVADEGKILRVARTLAPAVVAAAPPAAAVGAAETASDTEATDISENAVLSPMVGTVYLAHEPGAEPFVKVGDTVTEGQPVVIIEAMKTMNQIPAPKDGTVTEIFVGDAQPVEYGDPLMIIE